MAQKKRLSVAEIEELPYYDFMSYLGASFFQIGGPAATERLAGLCHLDSETHVLFVGCGSGFGACHIAKKFGCRVTGVDIAKLSIEKANERAADEGLSDRVEFKVGDAYDLPFGDGTFDVVIMEFVAQFLDNARVFPESTRVLRKGGYLGIDELYKDEQMSSQAAQEIEAVEELLSRITGFPFVIYTPTQWREYYENAGFTVTELIRSHDYMGLRDFPHIIREVGGISALTRTFYLMIRLYFTSSLARERFNALQKVKAVLLRKKSTKKHVGYVLCAGRKD